MKARSVLFIIVIAQFCCTTLWFAGNAVMADLLKNFQLDESALGHLSSVVQLGFIAGTFLFAFFTIVDRFSPTKVFFCSAISASISNLFMIRMSNDLESLLVIRFLVGFFLAGIYPVGMKIAADHFDQGLGKALGMLVGALVLGTAFPHFLASMDYSSDWVLIIYSISGLSFLGGSVMFVFVSDGPFRKASSGLDFSSCFTVFLNGNFRRAAFGYFGHMWELYTFWVFVPVIISSSVSIHSSHEINISLWSFYIIAIGSLSCVLGGLLSVRFGAGKVASFYLLSSCLCCLLLPFLIGQIPQWLLLIFLLFWGAVVVGDSPLLSTLVARSVDPETKGTALTIVTCIGFSLTIISIELMSFLYAQFGHCLIFILLGIGPLFGLLSMNVGKQ